MKTTMIVLLLFFLLTSSYAQDDSSSKPVRKYKISLTYGISAINPTEINDHISISNTIFSSIAKRIRSIPEIAATLSIRPMQDDKIILVRGGYMAIERTYQLSIPETIDTTTVTGYTTGSIRETYTAYPLSIGVGLSSPTFDSQMQIEFIFGLGYIEEEASYIYSSGQRASYLKSYFSPAYGLRISGQTTIRFADEIGLTLDLGYRWLTFDDYENETTSESSDIKFSYSGIQGSIGLSFIF